MREQKIHGEANQNGDSARHKDVHYHLIATASATEPAVALASQSTLSPGQAWQGTSKATAASQHSALDLICAPQSSRSLVDLQECGEAFADFIEQLDWSHVSHFDVSFLPGETAHLVY